MTVIKKGKVKWFSPLDHYGYIAVDGDSDVFLHWTVLRAVGVFDVTPDSPITVEAVNSEKGWRRDQDHQIGARPARGGSGHTPCKGRDARARARHAQMV